MIHAQCGRTIVPYLRRQLRAAHGRLKSPLREVSVALVSDATMSRLHEQYLGARGPTDVLTFELEHDGRGRPISGEVVVCVPQARRQSRRGLREEVLLLGLHGLLHLCGFDDRTERGFAAMHRAEDRILRELGVGPVFSGAATGIER